MSAPDGKGVFWDSGWQNGAATPAPQQPAILPAQPTQAPASMAIGANAATSPQLLYSNKGRMNGGSKGSPNTVKMIVLAVVGVGLLIGNVSLVNASNAYVPWSQTEATVLGGPIVPEAFLTTATVYLEENNGTAYYEGSYEQSETSCSSSTDEYGNTYEDCWTDYWTEYECYADLDLRWTVNGTEYQAWEYSPTLYDVQPCLWAIEDVFAPGTNLTIMVNPSNPEAYWAFEFALMTEFDPEHETRRTGYKQTTSYAWEASNAVVLVSECSMEPAVVYTFDGVEHTTDLWGFGGPMTDGWGESCFESYIASFGPGTTLSVMVDTEDPGRAEWEDPTTDPGAFIGTAMCCSVIVFLVAFVVVFKFDHTPIGRRRHGNHHYGRHHGHHRYGPTRRHHRRSHGPSGSRGGSSRRSG
ncbi:MAG: hypothetical protein CMA08_01845, partial [Euryarchaeota archaeon]|nr:hypothetical protein [Euryarchaeota archaeon]